MAVDLELIDGFSRAICGYHPHRRRLRDGIGVVNPIQQYGVEPSIVEVAECDVALRAEVPVPADRDPMRRSRRRAPPVVPLPASDFDNEPSSATGGFW